MPMSIKHIKSITTHKHTLRAFSSFLISILFNLNSPSSNGNHLLLLRTNWAQRIEQDTSSIGPQSFDSHSHHKPQLIECLAWWYLMELVHYLVHSNHRRRHWCREKLKGKKPLETRIHPSSRYYFVIIMLCNNPARIKNIYQIGMWWWTCLISFNLIFPWSFLTPQYAQTFHPRHICTSGLSGVTDWLGIVKWNAFRLKNGI